MVKEIQITVENRFMLEKRDLNVYRHAARSAHMISYGNSIPLGLKPVSEGDYLHISIVSGPGDMKSESIVKIPSWLDFEFLKGQDTAITHSSNNVLVRIPPGPAAWELRVTLVEVFFYNHEASRVTIGDAKEK